MSDADKRRWMDTQRAQTRAFEEAMARRIASCEARQAELRRVREVKAKLLAQVLDDADDVRLGRSGSNVSVNLAQDFADDDVNGPVEETRDQMCARLGLLTDAQFNAL